MVKNLQVPSLGREDPLKEVMSAHPVFLPGKPHGQRSLMGCSPGSHKKSDTIDRPDTHACKYYINYPNPLKKAY